jgi:hypothetical protein
MMTVAQLIKQLEKQDPQKFVYLSNGIGANVPVRAIERGSRVVIHGH